VLTVSLVLAIGTASAQPVSIDAKTLKQLQETIEQQQLLMQKQTQELKSQSEMLNALQKQVNDLSNKASAATTQAAEAKVAAEQAKTTAETKIVDQDAFRRMVTAVNPNVKLAISGQVNRAVNMVDDGDNTKAYYVDNDASNTRIRFIGTAKMAEDLTIGSRLEFAVAPNESSTVTQGNEGGDENYLQARWAEVSFDSKSYGKLSLGKGDTASNNTAEVDLSRVDVVDYASISDIVAGIQFRTTNGKQ